MTWYQANDFCQSLSPPMSAVILGDDVDDELVAAILAQGGAKTDSFWTSGWLTRANDER